MKIPTRILLATSIVFGLIFVPAVLPANAQTVTIIEAAAEQYPIKIDDQSFVIFYGYGGSSTSERVNDFFAEMRYMVPSICLVHQCQDVLHAR